MDKGDIRDDPRHPRSIEAPIAASAHILIPYTKVKNALPYPA
jgi:hypothetical protein